MYRAVIKRTSFYVFPDYFVGFFVGIGEPARHLRIKISVVHERKRADIAFAFLHFHFVVVDAVFRNARGRSRFETADIYAET